MTRDETEPGGAWEFDEEVAQAFDDMLERSIPQYEVMRSLCTDLADRFVGQRGAGVVDLGASRGEGISRVIEKIEAQPRVIRPYFHPVEVSLPMRKVLEERWPYEKLDRHHVKVHAVDLRQSYPQNVGSVAVTLCVLTLQFIPIEYRYALLRRAWERTQEGGAIILVEKILGATADLDALLLETYYDLKETNGYSQEQIERKRLSLEGVLVPVSASMNEELLRGAGFTEIETFWRWANFAGWLAIKPRRV